VVTRWGSQLQFSVNPAPYKHIQKVEFYIEPHFVGAAFSQPYSVAVNEDNLTAGTHTVTAKIYLDGTGAKSSQPATFMATPKTPPALPADSDTDSIVPASPPSSPATPGSPAALPAPTDLSGAASSDGTSVTLSWTGPEGAVGYRVWRDGVQVATTTGTGFTDTGLNPGQTYDYSVVALDADSKASAASGVLAVTMPTPPANNPEDAQPAKTDSPSPSPDAASTSPVDEAAASTAN
jgi:hypothetical protein